MSLLKSMSLPKSKSLPNRVSLPKKTALPGTFVAVAVGLALLLFLIWVTDPYWTDTLLRAGFL